MADPHMQLSLSPEAGCLQIGAVSLHRVRGAAIGGLTEDFENGDALRHSGLRCGVDKDVK